MRHRIELGMFLTAVIGAGLFIGWATAPGEWYARLEKPAFTPPGWLFGPVWTALYALIAVAGWRIWRRNRRGSAMKLWAAQLALNFAWSPLFFGAHRIDVALAIILLLLAAIVAFMAAAWRVDRASALLFAPYAMWTGFAAVLNAAIARLN